MMSLRCSERKSDFADSIERRSSGMEDSIRQIEREEMRRDERRR